MTGQQTAERAATAFEVTIRCERCGEAIGGTSVDPEIGDRSPMSDMEADIATDLVSEIRYHALGVVKEQVPAFGPLFLFTHGGPYPVRSGQPRWVRRNLFLGGPLESHAWPDDEATTH